MPSYPWLTGAWSPREVTRHMRGCSAWRPYTDEQIAAAESPGKTELDAVVAYLQGLGRNAPRGQ